MEFRLTRADLAVLQGNEQARKSLPELEKEIEKFSPEDQYGLLKGPARVGSTTSTKLILPNSSRHAAGLIAKAGGVAAAASTESDAYQQTLRTLSHHVLHEPHRQLLRQCSNGAVLLVAQA